MSKRNWRLIIEMNIGTDIDDVLVDFMKFYIDFYNSKNNTSLSLNDIDGRNLQLIMGKTREEIEDSFREFYLTKEFSELTLFEGVKDSLNQLSKNHNIFFITSRPPKISKKTEDFLKSTFSFDFEVFHTDFDDAHSHKADICLNKNIDIMIEDSLKNAEEISKNGITCFLLNKPWNKSERKSSNIICVKNWKEIMEKIK